MARHKVSMTLPKRPIENADATFYVKRNDQLIGTLKVSKGAIEWTPRSKQTAGTIKKSWAAFDKLMRGE